MSVGDALSERFVVVRGTDGSDVEREAADRWGDDFADAWKRTTFVACRVTDDARVAEAEEHESNLVLIGCEATNAVWGRLAARIPLKLTKDAIEVAGRTYRGSGLSVQAVFPHPDYPERKLVFIGSANPATAVFGTQELAIDGWFGYAIWSSESGKPRLLAAERHQTDMVAIDLVTSFLAD